ncbi:Arginine transport ATP-binding protein ArtM [subsurface metagenome]
MAEEYGRGLSKDAAESEALQILDMVDLLEKRDILARDLTAITLKRLELARALATSPTLLLLDEVAAGLNEEEIPRILEILQRVREMGIAYILVEHVMRVMTRVVDRIIVMDKGAKIAEGPPR